MWSSPQYDSWKWKCCGLKGSLLPTGSSNFAFLTNGKISSQKALLVCVKNRGSSGGVQSLPLHCNCKHQEQVSAENTLFSKPANNNCCLPENLLRVCWYKVLLCRAFPTIFSSVTNYVAEPTYYRCVRGDCWGSACFCYSNRFSFTSVSFRNFFAFAFIMVLRKGFSFSFPFRSIKAQCRSRLVVSIPILAFATFLPFALTFTQAFR